MATLTGALHRVAVVAPILALGCYSPDSRPAAPEIEQIDPDAVVVVGTHDAIGKIEDAVTSADGTIWILNRAEPYYLAMSPEGSVIRRGGTSGGGPSEFRGPNTLVAEPETGHVWVYDGGHHALMRIDGPDGQEISESIIIARDLIPSGQLASTETAGMEGGRAWIRGTEKGFLLAVSRGDSSPPTRLWNTRLEILAPDGSVEVVYALANHLGDPAAKFGATATEFRPYPLWALCPDGAVAFYDPAANSIGVLTPDDEVVDSIPLPPERGIRITVDRVFRMAWAFMVKEVPADMRPDSTSMYNQLQLAWRSARDRVSEVLPEYADLECPTENTFWIQPFDPDRGTLGRGPLWIRIGPDRSERRFEFPARFEPLRFETDRVLGVSRGEFDVESIAWVALPGS